MIRILPLLLLAVVASGFAMPNQPLDGELEKHLIYLGAIRVYSHTPKGGDRMKPELLTVTRHGEQIFQMRLVEDHFLAYVERDNSTRIFFISREAGYRTVKRLMHNLTKDALPRIPFRRRSPSPELKIA